MNILFFASLAEATGCQSFDLQTSGSVKSIKDRLEQQFPALKKYKYVIAVNHEIVKEDLLLNENDEVALLPPFSGG